MATGDPSTTTTHNNILTTTDFLTGAQQALPLVLGYLPVGIAYGVLAREIGLSVFETVLMSVFVLAGSSQFIAVSLLSMGSPAGAIIFTTFLVNLRHLLMSAALVPYLRGVSRPFLAVLAFGLTDETFAISSTYYGRQQSGPGFLLGVTLVSHVAWVLSGLLGALLGNLFMHPEKLGLNFALPAMLIALLLMQVKNRVTTLVAIGAGLLSLSVALVIPGNWNIIIATIIAATLGVILEKCPAQS